MPKTKTKQPKMKPALMWAVVNEEGQQLPDAFGRVEIFWTRAEAVVFKYRSERLVRVRVTEVLKKKGVKRGK